MNYRRKWDLLIFVFVLWLAVIEIWLLYTIRSRLDSIDSDILLTTEVKQLRLRSEVTGKPRDFVLWHNGELLHSSADTDKTERLPERQK